MGVRQKSKPSFITSVRVSPEYWDLCKAHNIMFSEALRVGISIILAERGIREYDNNLNISRKLIMLNKKLEETSQELWDLKEVAGRLMKGGEKNG